MSTSTIANIEYITAHPLSWSKDVRESLKVEIVTAARYLPAQRSLARVKPVDPSDLAVVGLLIHCEQYSGFGGFLYRCLKSVKSANDEPLDVSFSPDPIQLKRPTDPVFIFAKHYNYRQIPFLAYVTPEDVRLARKELKISDDGTFDTTSYYLAVLIALSQQAVKFLETKRDSYPAYVAYPTEDGKEMIVLSALVPTRFLDKFEQGTDQTDSLEVSCTTIEIGDGSSIAQFAKLAIASALEPETPEQPIMRGKYFVRVRRSPAKQQQDGATSVLRVV